MKSWGAFIFMAMSVVEMWAAGRTFSTRSEVIAPSGMAATSQPLATQAAVAVLQAGGSAVDAAIAANAVLGLVEPTGCGMGGDLFAIVWDAKTQKLHGLNASGRSPRSLKLEWFKENGHAHIPALGPISVSVPGCVDGWFALHGRFGRLPMKRLLQPAIDYATKGFPLSPVIAGEMGGSVATYRSFAGFAETYMPGGHMPRAGERFQNPRLARSYQQIAEGGRDAFYKGAIAQVIAKHMAAHGGFITAEDLAQHHSEWVEPVSATYRGYTVWELPPNGQGIAALQMLNILEGYDVGKMGFGSAAYLHALVEAKKLAFEDRAKHYADPAFAKLPVQRLISKPYAEERRRLIKPDAAAAQFPAGDFSGHDTIYLTTADADGNMVSLIQSNFRGFGSGVVPGDLGFVLQSRGELFALQPGHANVYAPGKRPFHTIIPAFVTRDGKPWLSFGVMGGDMQPQGHVQVLVNLIDFGMSLQAAGDAPRVRHSGSSAPTGERMINGGTVWLEPGFSATTIAALEKLGHRVQVQAGGYGGYQAIRHDAKEKVYHGASESRKDGHAAGY